MMPDVDGFEVLSALKADSGTASIPVVMLTGKADPRFADAAVEAGALCVLYKPWKYDELIAAIRGAIS
jgi:CheY-like chemotaxis protein